MNKINQIKEFNNYLDALNNLKNRYMVLIAMQDSWCKCISQDLAKKLCCLGIKEELFTQNEASYIAILDKGTMIYECIGKHGEVSYYKGRYADSEIDIISKANSAKFHKNTESQIGISINHKQLTFNKRGISFVVYDKYTSMVIDAVSFDTSLTSFTDFRITDYSKLLLGQLSELHIGFGYSIAQWLYDFEFNNITICIDPQFSELVTLTALSLKMNDKIVVKNRFTLYPENYNLEYKYGNYFQCEEYVPLDVFAIQSQEVVVHVSPIPNNELRNITKKAGVTYFEITELLNNAFSYIRSEAALLRLLSENPGVKIATYAVPEFQTDKSDEANSIRTNQINRGTIIRELKAGIRDSDRVSQYIREDSKYTIEDWLELIAYPNPESYNDEFGHRKFHDKSGKHLNIANGYRVTTYIPKVYDNTIYILGGCNTFGIYNSDQETYSSQLQKRLNENSKRKYRVENYGHFLALHWCDLVRVIDSIKPKQGDIILCLQGKNDFSKFPHFPINRIEKPTNYGHLYCDNGHYSANMHRFIAEKMFDMLVKYNFFAEEFQDFKYRTSTIPLMGFSRNTKVENDFSDEYSNGLKKYKKELIKIKEKQIGKIGAIVMNCNPFTMGHRYLIEYASNKVDFLFVFAVEEDKSIFSFKDRYELIKQGTVDLDNVTVLPSGKFIISSLTFSDYFQKSKIQERNIDPSQDVMLFAKEIAPTLGITVRFAGEEPFDNITAQYNDAMRKILPQYGMTFEEIPRKESAGEVISASRVRKLLADNNFEQIEKIVPPSTLAYLKARAEND